MQVECKGEALQAAEARLAMMRTELATKLELVTQMQQAMAEAEQSTWCCNSGVHGPAVEHVSSQARGMRRPHCSRYLPLTDISLPLFAALSSEHVARTTAEQQLVQQRRALLQEVQQVRAAGERQLRQLQHQNDLQRRQLEAELDRQAAQAVEQQRATAAAHEADVQRMQVGSLAWTSSALQRAALQLCIGKSHFQLCIGTNLALGFYRRSMQPTFKSCSYALRLLSSWCSAGMPSCKRPASS